MIQFSNRFLLALLIAFSVAACTPESDNADNNNDAPDVIDADTNPSDESDGLGEDEEGDEQDIPTQITTVGAAFEGVIPAQGALDVTLVANKNDTVVMWLRVDGDDVWDPEISIYPSGDSNNPLVFDKSENGDDAHIPYQANQIQDGFDFHEGDSYRLELANASDVEGRFKFTLECLGGPCDTSDPGNGDDPGDPNDPEESPYDDLSNSDLRAALKATHTADHSSLGYKRARDFMFQYDMDNVGAQDEIECIYTGRTAFIEGRIDAQNQTPMWNTEHTWPQSRGASGTAKSDLHHLFVIDANINQKRGNYTFDYVVNVDYEEGGSKLGTNANGETRFEVRDIRKGDVARAIFYFAVVYDFPIDADEEAALRQWHVSDPVNAAEQARNTAVEGVQGNRNFFIDYPHLVEQIADF